VVFLRHKQDNNKVSNDIVIDLSNIYPGMDSVSEKIDIKNLGDSDAVVNYSILSARMFDEELDITSYSKGLLEDKMAHDYPFHINVGLSKKFVRGAKNDVSSLDVTVTWPLDSDNDKLDSEWGSRAYAFQKSEDDRANKDNNYQARSSIKLVISLKAEQYLTDDESIDMLYTAGDEILYDVVTGKKCSSISSTCLKTYVLDVDSKVGAKDISLLPDLFNSYTSGSFDNYSSLLSSAKSGWNVTTRGLRAKDLVHIISSDYSNSFFVRERLSDEVVGNMDYPGRVEKEVLRAKEKNGSFRFRNDKYPYLATSKCYWLEDEYDTNGGFALVKVDDTVSKIYKEAKSSNCSVVPVITVPKSSIYS